jgi:predicted ATPase/class 3 adenylate cyclase
MPDLPTGTVTFLFTDIEGSTRLWEQHPRAMEAALARHDLLAAEIIGRHGGMLVKHRGEGDSLFAVFSRASEAVAAAGALQQALVAEPWPSETQLSVRIAVHTGEAQLREGDYYGPAVNRCARLRACAYGAQVLLSATTCALVQDDLPANAALRDLGRHRLRDLQRPEQIFQLCHSDLPADFPPLRSLETFPNNLPQQVTSFIGREREMEDVKRLLETTRLLTLAGSGGTGKTRLALQVAADLLSEYADGVWLVELAPLSDVALVPQTVAAALAVREEPGKPIGDTLVEALKAKRLLLVIDNCEHILPACGALAEALLRSCPGVQILATSREGLNIAGERTYRLPSLSLPDTRQVMPAVESLTQYEAVRLFIDRAVAVFTAFAVTNANAPAVAQVCARLDGIPLAIELAAARVKVLSVEQIAERLDDRFRLLTGGSRTALPRQQTLRALIDWSYDLLSETERGLLRRVSVFAGGWTLEAAEAISAGGDIERWELLDLLTQLVEKSLVLFEEQKGAARYRLLETMRQYARDRLLESGEGETMRHRHRDFFLALAQEAEPKLRTSKQEAWLERLEVEHDNLRAALEWSLGGADEAHGSALRLASALGFFWNFRGYFTEGRRWMEGALAQTSSTEPSPIRATVLHELSRLARYQGDLKAARSYAEEGLAMSLALGDEGPLALALMGLAMTEADPRAMRPPLEQALALARAQGDRWVLSLCLANLALDARLHGAMALARARAEEAVSVALALGEKFTLAYAYCILAAVVRDQGDARAARALCDQSLEIARGLKLKAQVVFGLIHAALAARDLADYAAARSYAQEALTMARELDHKFQTGWSLLLLGQLARDQRDYPAARAFFRESLAIDRERHRWHWPGLLEAVAGLAAAEGQPVRVARLCGAAEALREEFQTPLVPADVPEYQRHVASARTALSAEVFTAAWAEGRAMSPEQLIRYALGEPTDD